VVAHHQVLNITATTYVDDLHVTFIALREAIPDLRRLADYTAAAVPQLEADITRRTPRQPAARAPAARKRGPRRNVAKRSLRRGAVR
jgi:hypothetical protein